MYLDECKDCRTIVVKTSCSLGLSYDCQECGSKFELDYEKEGQGLASEYDNYQGVVFDEM